MHHVYQFKNNCWNNCNLNIDQNNRDCDYDYFHNREALVCSATVSASTQHYCAEAMLESVPRKWQWENAVGCSMRSCHCVPHSYESTPGPQVPSGVWPSAEHDITSCLYADPFPPAERKWIRFRAEREPTTAPLCGVNIDQSVLAHSNRPGLWLFL